MRRTSKVLLLVFALGLVASAAFAQQQGEQKFGISGVSYTKWLWGDQRLDGAMFNFTTVPGEGYGDNGQGTEIELLVFGKPNKYIEVNGRIHSRFNQNFWTNFGGFGGRNPALEDPPAGGCTSGDCGEWDPRSNQYVKLRGLTMRVTPGYRYLDSVTIGASDWGMFDPFTVGKIRYIDRDNGSGLLAQGTLGDKALAYDIARISLPRLWAGPNWNTGQFHTQDSAYVMQFRYAPSAMFDLAVIGERVRDVEIESADGNVDDGLDLDTRFDNDVYGVRFGVHPSSTIDVRGVYYTSSVDSNPAYGAPEGFGMNGYSPIPAGDLDDQAYKLNVDFIDPFGVGLSLNAEYFNIGEGYTSIMAARRESDVLLTEGHDGTWAFPGPSNASYGVWGGNETKIGYAGWQGNAQQVATLNVDNDFTDFDEPLAETVIGWKGITLVPRYQAGDLDIAAELTWIDYNTNWQAWGDDSRAITNTIWPAHELDAGVGHNFRSAYAPFQDKETMISVLRGRYVIGAGKGIDVFGKLKFIDETDKRLNDEKYLPYVAGDCPGGGAECAGARNFYSPGLSTADFYGNPGLVTVGGVTGYQWAPFDEISDDDRDLDYKMVQIGAGYQFTDILYSSLTFERYDVDLQDGNTAFQAYQLMEMSSGEHKKNKVILSARFPIGGVEAGLNYEYAFGTFDPDFGDGFVPQVVGDQTARDVSVPVGSLGFSGRWGGWNSLEEREFDHQHLKAFLKVRF